ncbi:MAG: hypothetical protein H0W72_13995 [Planctomycetes bacterium]|nr:hypothetical protein [Planctomycetota bacterium]
MEVLVVAIVIVVLVGLLLPAISVTSCPPRHRSADGNNLKQVMTAIIAYQGQEEAIPLGRPPGSWVCVGAADARVMTIRSFEVLADVMTLPPGIWRSKNNARGRPPSRKPDRHATVLVTGPGGWADEAAGVAMDWGYDWALPAECANYRIVVAARNPGFYRNKLVLASSYDGSVRQCKATTDPAVGANVTAGSTDGDIRCVHVDAQGAGVLPTPGTEPDSLFNGVNDRQTTTGAAGGISPQAQGPGTGSPRRCFLK